MSAINWDSRPYQAGVSRGVVFDPVATAWNGLINVAETSTQMSKTDIYVDGVLVSIHESVGPFEASIEAFTYPEPVEEHLTQRNPLGFSYRIETDSGYQIHLVYNATLYSKERSFPSLGSTISPTVFKFDLRTRMIADNGFMPNTHLYIDTESSTPAQIEWLENKLYGTTSSDGYLPTPEEIGAIFSENALLIITDHGDGSWSAQSDDPSVVSMIDSTSFRIDSLGVHLVDGVEYWVETY